MHQIVTEGSAAPIFDNTERAGLGYDHRNMCRFASRTAPGYRLVMAAILRYSRGAPAAISQRWTDQRSILDSLRQQEARELQGIM